eukprot:TRINITY_DN487_c0_g2_i1.p1 TRINITY_DN487_c0_g2~~TRINITY_DN487_c0_g2_i1.p1  ORF type:complete len:874 (+),score=213.21 TRINITY_DN487_c0_g2_i1:134-2755(+)
MESGGEDDAEIYSDFEDDGAAADTGQGGTTNTTAEGGCTTSDAAGAAMDGDADSAVTQGNRSNINTSSAQAGARCPAAASVQRQRVKRRHGRGPGRSGLYGVLLHGEMYYGQVPIREGDRRVCLKTPQCSTLQQAAFMRNVAVEKFYPADKSMLTDVPEGFRFSPEEEAKLRNSMLQKIERRGLCPVLPAKDKKDTSAESGAHDTKEPGGENTAGQPRVATNPATCGRKKRRHGDDSTELEIYSQRTGYHGVVSTAPGSFYGILHCTTAMPPGVFGPEPRAELRTPCCRTAEQAAYMREVAVQAIYPDDESKRAKVSWQQHFPRRQQEALSATMQQHMARHYHPLVPTAMTAHAVAATPASESHGGDAGSRQQHPDDAALEHHRQDYNSGAGSTKSGGSLHRDGHRGKHTRTLSGNCKAAGKHSSSSSSCKPASGANASGRSSSDRLAADSRTRGAKRSFSSGTTTASIRTPSNNTNSDFQGTSGNGGHVSGGVAAAGPGAAGPMHEVIDVLDSESSDDGSNVAPLSSNTPNSTMLSSKRQRHQPAVKEKSASKHVASLRAAPIRQPSQPSVLGVAATTPMSAAPLLAQPQHTSEEQHRDALAVQQHTSVSPLLPTEPQAVTPSLQMPKQPVGQIESQVQAAAVPEPVQEEALHCDTGDSLRQQVPDRRTAVQKLTLAQFAKHGKDAGVEPHQHQSRQQQQQQQQQQQEPEVTTTQHMQLSHNTQPQQEQQQMMSATSADVQLAGLQRRALQFQVRGKNTLQLLSTAASAASAASGHDSADQLMMHVMTLAERQLTQPATPSSSQQPQRDQQQPVHHEQLKAQFAALQRRALEMQVRGESALQLLSPAQCISDAPAAFAERIITLVEQQLEGL